jgi:adenylate kinase
VRIVLLGPPGAGKGSLASWFHARLRVPHLSTGEIFRQEIGRRSALGRRVQGYVSRGRLVPDALVVQVMAGRLKRMPGRGGFVLDGFPRTQGQAAGLDRVLARMKRPLDGAVYLTSPTALLIRRLSGRRVCGSCGENYHIRTMRPKKANQCDRCGGRLVTRKDDEPATIRRRLRIDREAAAPLLRYYRQRGQLYTVDGRGRIDKVFVRTEKLVRRNGWMARAHDRAQKRLRD